MSPKLRTLLARIILVGGMAGLGVFLARSAPRDQSIAIRLGDRQLTRLEGVVIQQGDTEPTAGFSQEFPGRSPRTVRHDFSAPNGTYIIVITFADKPTGQVGTRADNQGKEAAPARGQGGAEAPPTNQDNDPALRAGELNPIPSETRFERRVSLVGGEVIVSPD